MESLRYPIGHFQRPEVITNQDIQGWIDTLEIFPDRLTRLVSNLTDIQLATPYRDGGWTIRQVIHHCADSHHHSYIRFKWALTEKNPVIKAYNESDWAELHDTKSGPIHLSLNHLSAVHAKLVYLLKGLSEADLNHSFIHPESGKTILLKETIGMYAWHCNHHYAHIEQVLDRKNWL